MEQELVHIEDAECAVMHDRVVGIHAVKIWYCSYGRNAWHSTWTKRYARGCIQVTEEMAEQRAERTRNYGNVHYLSERPALRFVGRYHSLVVTQINTATPLSDYTLRASRRIGIGSGDNARESYFAFGVTLEDVAKSFSWNSPFWKVAQPRRDSVLCLVVGHPVEFAPLTGQERLAGWRSISYGSQYDLNWEKIPNPVRTNNLLNLARNAGFDSLTNTAPGCAKSAVPRKRPLCLVSAI